MMKKLLAALGITGSIVMVGGLAVASIPGPNGVINGCRSNSTGLVYIKDSSESCGFNMTAVPWNQTGPQGAPGPQGLQGTQGFTGPQGPAGPAGADAPTATYYQNPGEAQDAIPNYWTAAQASCNEGDELISGGAVLPGPTSLAIKDLSLAMSFRYTDTLSPEVWQVTYWNHSTTNTYQIAAIANCVHYE